MDDKTDLGNGSRSTRWVPTLRAVFLLLLLLIAGCVRTPQMTGGPEGLVQSSSPAPGPTSAHWPTATDLAKPDASGSALPATPAAQGPSGPPNPTPFLTPLPASPSPTSACPSEPTLSPAPPNGDQTALAAQVGQKLIVRMTGSTPDDDLLNRIAAGQIGGVILFGSNVTTPAALAALTTRLQAAAIAGGRPPLLIATDQEGGKISRIPWAPPNLSAPEMGSDGRASVAYDQGAAAGAALAAVGINVDLAPVADVPASPTSFIYLQGRTFSFESSATAALAAAFAAGLQSSGIVPAMKHFPGLGLANDDTDTHAVTIAGSLPALEPGLAPYRAAIDAALPLVMLSNATYAAIDPCNGAGWSSVIGTGLLRDQLGFTGVTITDSLTGTAIAADTTDATLAVRAATAGTDLILVSGNESSSRTVYAALLAAAEAGTIPISRLDVSRDRIAALKAGL